jgi:hypothetical protein
MVGNKHFIDDINIGIINYKSEINLGNNFKSTFGNHPTITITNQ